MRLNGSSRSLVFGNIELIKYCRDAGINMNKLQQCNIEKMGNLYAFVLSKEDAPKSALLIPLDVDLETQPDVVLTMDVSENNISFETTDKTRRIINI